MTYPSGLLTFVKEFARNTLPLQPLTLLIPSDTGAVAPYVRLHVLSRVGLKVTGTAGVPKWVVGTNCVEPRMLRVTGTAGVPIWVTGDKSVEGRVCMSNPSAEHKQFRLDVSKALRRTLDHTHILTRNKSQRLSSYRLYISYTLYMYRLPHLIFFISHLSIYNATSCPFNSSCSP